MVWLVMAVAGVIVVDAIFRLLVILLILPNFERMPPFGVEPSPEDSRARTFDFPTTDELTLRGSLYQHDDQPARGLILFCPEMNSNHFSAMSYCGSLWNAGFDIFAFDFRNQGESDSIEGYEPLHWLTDFEVQDVMSAIDFIQNDPQLQNFPLGLFGISRGGGAALAAASRSPHVECVACEGVFSTRSLLTFYVMRWAAVYFPQWMITLTPMWHLQTTLVLVRWISQRRRHCRYTNLERCLPRLVDMPVLMISGGGDTYVPPDVTKAVYSRIGSNSADLWIVPRAKHNCARAVDQTSYDEKLLDLFSCLSSSGQRSNLTEQQA